MSALSGVLAALSVAATLAAAPAAGGSSYLSQLTNDLKDRSAAKRILAARDLAALKDLRAVAPLYAAAGSEKVEAVRLEMLASLVRLGERSAHVFLQPYCISPYWQVALTAAQALEDAGDTQYLRQMVDVGLGDDDPDVRDGTLQALRALNAPGTLAVLRRAVAAEKGNGEAAYLSAFLGGPSEEPLLLAALNRGGSVAAGAGRGLAVMATPALVLDLKRRLYQPESAAGAAYALGLIGGPQAVTALFSAIDNPAAPKTAEYAFLAIMQQTFGFGVPGAEKRRTPAQWRQWWRDNQPLTAGFENLTIPLGLIGVRGIGHRLSWGDFDSDGYDDLLVSGRYLFHNDAGKAFTDATAKAGIGRHDVVAGVWADFNNDGRLDFYAPSADPNRRGVLWRNQGDGTFLDVTAQAGQVNAPYVSEAAAWGDFDADGYVDLLVANSQTPADPAAESDALDEEEAPDSQPAAGSASTRPVTRPAPRGNPYGAPSHLYRNRGDGTFKDVSEAAGLGRQPPRATRGLAWADFNNDGHLDLYLANFHYQPNQLWLNRGDGTFAEVGVETRASGWPHRDEDRTTGRTVEYFGRSLGCAWGDFDNDGALDLFVANIAPTEMIVLADASTLFKSVPPGGAEGGPDFAFRDVRPVAGITYEETHAEGAWGDYDNDGFLDLVVTSTGSRRRSYLYRNNGDGTFTDVTWATGVRVLDGWGCAWADFDRDGRLDLAVAGNYGIRLFRNVSTNGHHWLQVRLTGTKSNRAAIGARVTVIAGKRTQMREVSGGRGTGCQDSLVQHFGLGPQPGAVSVTVRWPNGAVQTLAGVKTDQRLEITEE
jgi:HEAT repeat protein